MNEQKIKQVITNHPELEEQLAMAESAEDVKAAFAACGCPLTDTDINELFLLVAVGDGELNEESLDNVAGGWRRLPYGGLDPRWTVRLWNKLKQLFK